MAAVDTRIVIRGATVARQPPGETTLIIEGRRIVRVARGEERVGARPGDWEVDADGRLVIAGGVDAHTHLAVGALLRLMSLPGYPALSVAELRSSFRGPLQARLEPAEIEALTAAGALAALRSGITCAFDLLRGAPGREEEELSAAARGSSAVGLRVALASAIDLNTPATGLMAASHFAANLADSSTQRCMLGLDGLAGVTHETLATLQGAAVRLGLHASIGEDEADLSHSYAVASLRPVQLIGSAGLLSPRSLVVHGGMVGHAESSILSHTGACAVVTPRAESLWGGHLPSPDLLAAREASVALGTDGLYSDLAGEGLTLSLHLRRSNSGRPLGDLVGHTIWPTGADLASRLFGERVGILEEGALADVVVLDWRPPFPLPEASDGDLALLWAGAPAAWAIVDGQVRLREGRLLGGSEAAIAARARQAAARVLGN